MIRYFVVLVDLSVVVAVPSGVSTVVREVEVVEDSAGLLASTVTLVEDDGGVGAGCITVVDELAGAEGSFTTVVEDVEVGRSHAAMPSANTTARGISLFIAVASSWTGTAS